MCREEKIKHKKRMRKLENLYRHNLRRMRKTLEVKLEKSATVLEEQREERKKKITECVIVYPAAVNVLLVTPPLPPGTAA